MTLLLLTLFSGCSTLKVSSDYDKSFDLSTLSTYYILEHNSTYNSLTNRRINSALTTTLKQKGYKVAKDKESATFYILYHLNVTNKTQINTDYQFVGLYPYRYGSTMVATTRSYNYDEGKLIIDIIDPKSKSIIFQAIATDELPNLKTPKEREAYIFKVISRALETLPSKP